MCSYSMTIMLVTVLPNFNDATNSYIYEIDIMYEHHARRVLGKMLSIIIRVWSYCSQLFVITWTFMITTMLKRTHENKEIPGSELELLALISFTNVSSLWGWHLLWNTSNHYKPAMICTFALELPFLLRLWLYYGTQCTAYMLWVKTMQFRSYWRREKNWC